MATDTSGLRHDASMRSRLDTVDPKLAADLTKLSSAAQRRVSIEVARLAVEHTELTDAVVKHALTLLERSAGPNADVEPALESVVDNLDQLAFDLNDRAEANQANDVDYEHAFGQARAAAAVAAAFDPDSLHAALEAVYEALAALLSPDAVRPVIAGAESPH
jgi:hypothetical protein